MTTIAEVRSSLAAAVETTGLQCSAYILDQIDAPCAMVGRGGFDPRLVMQSTKSVYPFKVSMFHPRMSDIDAQAKIDTYCMLSGSTSVKAAVENGSNWSASVDYAVVTNIGATVETEVAGIVYLLTEFDVEVCW